MKYLRHVFKLIYSSITYNILENFHFFFQKSHHRNEYLTIDNLKSILFLCIFTLRTWHGRHRNIGTYLLGNIYCYRKYRYLSTILHRYRNQLKWEKECTNTPIHNTPIQYNRLIHCRYTDLQEK